VLSVVRWFVVSLLFLSSAALHATSLPLDLKQGLLDYYLEQDQHARALWLLDEHEFADYPLHVAISQSALNIKEDFSTSALEAYVANSKQKGVDSLRIAAYYYDKGDCKRVLKYLKGKARGLDSSSRNKRTYLKAQCLIKLDFTSQAAEYLSKALEGEMAATAYYNLAAEYSTINRNPKKSLKALKVARDINYGKSVNEGELTNLINLGAGSLFLEYDKPELATQFFNEITLDSIYASQALYFAGMAKLDTKDYRGAIQAWNHSLQYGLAQPGVSESQIAMPQAQAQSGYHTQALESYMAASKLFLEEKNSVDQLITAIKKEGVLNVLVHEKVNKDLEWFLSNVNARNTRRSAYMRYLSQDPEIYQSIKEYQSFTSLQTLIEQHEVRFKSLTKSLASQQKRIKANSASKQQAAISKKIKAAEANLQQLKTDLPNLRLHNVEELIASMKQRNDSLVTRAKKRSKAIGTQLVPVSTLQKRTKAVEKALRSYFKAHDKYLTHLCVERLQKLKQKFVKHFEQAELGLIQILESQARLQTKRTNLLDGRYQ